MDREHVLNMLSLFYPDVRQTLIDVTFLLFDDPKELTDVYNFLQPKDELFRVLIAEEYIGSGEDRMKTRDGFTQMLGDLMFVVPAIKAANAHRGS